MNGYFDLFFFVVFFASESLELNDRKFESIGVVPA